MRPDVCSVRVCETSLSVLELLLDLGVVSCDAVDGSGRPEDPAWKASADNVDNSLVAKSHGICIDIVSRWTKLWIVLTIRMLHFIWYDSMVWLCFNNGSIDLFADVSRGFLNDQLISDVFSDRLVMNMSYRLL